jgi:DNA-binding MarR family transcriptional regulator
MSASGSCAATARMAARGARSSPAPRRQVRRAAAPATARQAPLDLEANLSYRLSILNFLMGKATQRIYTAEDLTSHQWKVLSVLHRFAPMPAFEIARWVTLDKAAISRAVRQLRDKGLADRRPDGGNGRAIDIMLTPKGARLYERMTVETAALQRSLLAGAGKNARLFAAIDDIEARLRSKLGLPPRA